MHRQSSKRLYRQPPFLYMVHNLHKIHQSIPTPTHSTHHSPQKRLLQRCCLLPWRKFKLLEHIQVSLEMTYLAMYGVVLVLIILVQVLISASQHGLLTLLGNRESLSSVGVAERAEKTVQNSVVAMALVAPAVLMLTLANLSTPEQSLQSNYFSLHVSRMQFAFFWG